MNRKRLRQILIGLLSTIVVIALILGGYLFWRDHRPQPPSVRETLFNGITYIRDVRQQPRPLIIHVVQIDLTTPGLSFLVTPGDPVDGHEVRAQTVSEFLSKYNLQLAINGDFFWPWWYHTILDYYPHDHDPTDVNGFAASRGAIYSEEQPDDPRPTLYLSLDNRAGIDQPIGAVYNAISGLPLIRRSASAFSGRTRSRTQDPAAFRRRWASTQLQRRRHAAGVGADRDRVWGRQRHQPRRRRIIDISGQGSGGQAARAQLAHPRERARHGASRGKSVRSVGDRRPVSNRPP